MSYVIQTSSNTDQLRNIHVILDTIDPIHARLPLFANQLSEDVWKDKYAYKAANEQTLKETAQRVVDGVYRAERKTAANVFESDAAMIMRDATVDAIVKGLFMPAGRILAGAGTTKRVTLMNCYVNSHVEDSMQGIMNSLTHCALTMQQGGGVGTCFSSIRPKNSILKALGEGAAASGPLPFMDMWNAMCQTIMSAGSRRGAMMATLSDTHPDLIDFIKAKQTPGRLTNFNLSILISDAFMEAVHDNEEWLLYFHTEPIAGSREPEIAEYDFVDDDGRQQYVYSVWKARELWDLITHATYQYSEPGVIFIDRINQMNNLQYLETIDCTNPCGEQPLPPHGTCNLAAIILSRMVLNPFTPQATFNWDLLRTVTRLGVRFLDNVIDVTNYPLDEQEYEEVNKRRLGLGITGLADALAQLGLKYGSVKASKFANDVMQAIAIAAYDYSVDLAIEKGKFALYDPVFLEQGFAAKKMPGWLRKRIEDHGIRNGLLLTIAPTGTTSIVFGNVSSGVEPVFAHHMKRKVLQRDNSWKDSNNYSFTHMLWCVANNLPFDTEVMRPEHLVTASDLTIQEHIRMQAACQEWVDSSVSKTVNIPTEMSYDDFVSVYALAYGSGCKGCTTYRPSEVRGSILEEVSKSTIANTPGANSNTSDNPPKVSPETLGRPDILYGATHKVRWPSMSAAMYITINTDENGKPYEMFFASKDARHSDWMTALTLMISGIFRSGVDPSFIPIELKQVTSMHDTAWIKSKFYASPVAYIGNVIEGHLNHLNTPSSPTTPATATTTTPTPPEVKEAPREYAIRTEPLVKGTNEVCPDCQAPAIIRTEGCRKCTNCTYSSCA